MQKCCRRLIAGMVLFALPSLAQPQTWNNVTAISPGTAIRIAGPRPGTIPGILQSATADSLALSSNAGQETFSREQITQVSVKKPSHRARNALIGLGVGAGAGLGIGAGADHSCAAHGCFLGNNLGKEIFTPLGAIVGALIGAVIPTGGWRAIYKQ